MTDPSASPLFTGQETKAPGPEQEETGLRGNMPGRNITILLVSVFIIAICGILYELLISTISSYFQGSSVLHFSLVIGLFLSFMGVGSFLSKYLERNLIQWFILFEILLGLIGGCAALILYYAFSMTPYFYGVAFALIAVLGSLIGVEIPVLTRVVRRYASLRRAMAEVLSFDYLGALIASVLFPLVLLPFLGTMRTAFVVGILNLGVAVINLLLFRKELPSFSALMSLSVATILLLFTGLVFSFRLVSYFEQNLYQDEILLTRQSPYQRMVVTRWNDDIRLFIDGNIQFSSRDEYRYHEPLVHLPMGYARSAETVLVLGGGDGLAVREILKYPRVQRIIVVDLDPEMTELGRDHPVFARLNDSALHDARVEIVNQDGYRYIEESSELFDVAIIDLPDPNHPALGKLYSLSFYRLLQKRLAGNGVVVTQSTSPYYAPRAFWCIHHTLEAVFPHVSAFHAYIPSFGVWGFNLAINLPAIGPEVERPDETAGQEAVITRISKGLFEYYSPLDLRYLNADMLPGLFQFDGDMAEQATETNRLDNQVLLRYYEQSWKDWR